MPQHGLVGRLVVQREHAFYVLPGTGARRDSSATKFLWPENEMMQCEDVLGFESAVDNRVFVAARVGLRNGIEPVLDSAMWH